MNRLRTLSLLFANSLLNYSQMTVPRRGMLSILGTYGIADTLIQPQVSIIGGLYNLILEKIEAPEPYDSKGNWIDSKGANEHYCIRLMYRLFNRYQTEGWILFVNDL